MEVIMMILSIPFVGNLEISRLLSPWLQASAPTASRHSGAGTLPAVQKLAVAFVQLL